MKLKNRNLYKKAFRAEFFLGAQKKISDINRVEEFKEDIMLDHRTETFMAVCNVMNYREAAELLHITQPAVTQHIQFLEKDLVPAFCLVYYPVWWLSYPEVALSGYEAPARFIASDGGRTYF